MYTCVWCVYLRLCHDEQIPCVVRLKPKLPGPVVDSRVSPTHCPKGSQDQDHCSGSVCSHTWNTGLDYTGLKYDSSQGGGGGRPFRLFCTNADTHTHIKRHTLPVIIATSQAQREDLVVPHTCQRQMLRINQKEAPSEEKLHTAVDSTNSLHSTLTGEQTAAHDNTHQWWK